MGARRAWFLAALLVVSVAPAAIAQPEDEVEMDPEDGGPAPDASPAEPDPATKAAAKKLLDGGDGFLKKGDYHKKRKRLPQAQAEFERALAAYQKAYEMVPNPKILFPIASAEERLERWVDAATHYSRFLSQAADVDAKLRAEAERRLEEVKLHIGVLSLASPLRISRVPQCRHCVACEQACPTGAIKGHKIDFKECVRCDLCERKLLDRAGVCRHDIDEVERRHKRIGKIRVVHQADTPG